MHLRLASSEPLTGRSVQRRRLLPAPGPSRVGPVRAARASTRAFSPHRPADPSRPAASPSRGVERESGTQAASAVQADKGGAGKRAG